MPPIVLQVLNSRLILVFQAETSLTFVDESTVSMRPGTSQTIRLNVTTPSNAAVIGLVEARTNNLGISAEVTITSLTVVGIFVTCTIMGSHHIYPESIIYNTPLCLYICNQQCVCKKYDTYKIVRQLCTPLAQSLWIYMKYYIITTVGLLVNKHVESQPITTGIYVWRIFVPGSRRHRTEREASCVTNVIWFLRRSDFL